MAYNVKIVRSENCFEPLQSQQVLQSIGLPMSLFDVNWYLLWPPALSYKGKFPKPEYPKDCKAQKPHQVLAYWKEGRKSSCFSSLTSPLTCCHPAPYSLTLKFSPHIPFSIGRILQDLAQKVTSFMTFFLKPLARLLFYYSFN